MGFSRGHFLAGKISPKEFNLLTLFVRRERRGLTQDEFLNQVWAYNSCVGHRGMDRLVATLRIKIDPEGNV